MREKAQKYRESQKSTLVDGTTPQYKCNECRDEDGYFVKRPVKQTVKGELVEVMMDHWHICDCVAKRKNQEQTDALFQSSKITWAFQKRTFDSFDLSYLADPVRAAYRKARTYHSRFADIRTTPNNGICLLGKPGSGKTHLLTAISNALLSEGVEVLYAPFVQCIEEMKNDMHKEEINKARIEKMQKVEVLFIDDLFKPPNTPSAYEIRKMYEVINYRYMEQMPIMISSERKISELVDIDEALGSRINEMCRDFRVELDGGRELNYRMREGA
ncbi:ATP-binding protein [Paenibacillus sp. HJGM_3]|uniref:ATP-binding protein n=1 Tax=Paenibacillus sp. HJGM_3 TaxID=3379816 RepID=UPI00385E545D